MTTTATNHRLVGRHVCECGGQAIHCEDTGNTICEVSEATIDQRTYEVDPDSLTVSFYRDGYRVGHAVCEDDGSDDPDLPLYDLGERWVETGRTR